MAYIYVPTDEIRKARAQWVAVLPPAVRATAERFEPWKAYRIKSTGVAVHLVGINGDGTLTLEQDDGLRNEGQLFPNVDPNDVEECEAPPWVAELPDEVEAIRMASHVKACLQIGSGEVSIEAVMLPVERGKD